MGRPWFVGLIFQCNWWTRTQCNYRLMRLSRLTTCKFALANMHVHKQKLATTRRWTGGVWNCQRGSFLVGCSFGSRHINVGCWPSLLCNNVGCQPSLLCNNVGCHRPSQPAIPYHSADLNTPSQEEIWHTNTNYQPMSFFRRYSNCTRGRALVKISPSCSTVSIFINLILSVLINSRNQIVLMW